MHDLASTPDRTLIFCMCDYLCRIGGFLRAIVSARKLRPASVTGCPCVIACDCDAVAEVAVAAELDIAIGAPVALSNPNVLEIVFNVASTSFSVATFADVTKSLINSCFT